MLWSPLAVLSAYVLGCTVQNVQILSCEDRQLTQSFYRATHMRDDQQAVGSWTGGWIVWTLDYLVPGGRVDTTRTIVCAMFIDVLLRNVQWVCGDLSEPALNRTHAFRV